MTARSETGTGDSAVVVIEAGSGDDSFGPASTSLRVARLVAAESGGAPDGAEGAMAAMERVEAELFTDGGNYAVVRLPPRQFPGVLVQGDSLSVIRDDVAEIRDLCRSGDVAEALELAELLVGDLEEILLRYTDALDRHGMRIPFVQGT